MTKEKRVVNRYFCAILYPEDANYKEYMQYIQTHYAEVTFINHNRDIDEDGETKKLHTHILFKVGDNARHLTKVAKEIGILPNYLQGCNKDAMLLYFMHRNNPEKTQYKFEEVQGVLTNHLKRLLLKQIPEEDKYNKLIIAIQEGQIKTYTSLMLFAIKNGVMSEVRKSQFILSKIIEEKWKTKKEDVDK